MNFVKVYYSVTDDRKRKDNIFWAWRKHSLLLLYPVSHTPKKIKKIDSKTLKVFI